MADSLVIGGGGFIGRRLVNLLLESGRTVRVMSRSADPQLGRPGLVLMRGAVSQPEAVRAAVDGVKEVFHLATGGGNQWSDFERDFLDGTRHVIDACRSTAVRRLIFTSSTAALYLGAPGIMRDPAQADPQPEKRAFYGRAKALAERLVVESGLPAVILRPAIVVGKGSAPTHSGVGYWASDLSCIGWGDGRNPLPFVLVDDVARAMALAIDAPGIDGRSYNLAGDIRPTAREYVDLLAERSFRRYRFHPRSLALLQSIEILKWVVKVAARKPENAFPGFRDLESRSFRTQIDCSAAKEQLGWRPNADREVFVREAIDAHIRPVPAGDLRLAAAHLE